MLSKNIIFKNFQQKNQKNRKKINNILKKEIINCSSLLNSFKKNYKYIVAIHTLRNNIMLYDNKFLANQVFFFSIYFFFL